jgi:hypothetical protein
VVWLLLQAGVDHLRKGRDGSTPLSLTQRLIHGTSQQLAAATPFDVPSSRQESPWLTVTRLCCPKSWRSCGRRSHSSSPGTSTSNCKSARAPLLPASPPPYSHLP